MKMLGTHRLLINSKLTEIRTVFQKEKEENSCNSKLKETVFFSSKGNRGEFLQLQVDRNKNSFFLKMKKRRILAEEEGLA